MDKRLVRTVLSGIVALLAWRKRAHGLLLSEVGAYVLDPAHAPAGAKRLSTLLRSPHWSAEDLTAYVWRQADVRLQALATVGEEAQVIWDQRVVEKPESLAAPDLGAVRASKARRLTRIKPGFYHPPSRPIFVPGWQWLGLLLLGQSGASGPPTVAHMRWWSGGALAARTRVTAGPRNTRSCATVRGGGGGGGSGSALSGILGSWDRGCAGPPWLQGVLERQLRFVLRWPGRAKRLGPRTGWQPAKAWELARGQRSWEHRSWEHRSWEHRLLWDARHHCPRHHCPRHHCPRRTGVLALPVWLPDDRTHLRPSGWSSLAGEVARNRGIS